jgi:hypothetical protein
MAEAHFSNVLDWEGTILSKIIVIDELEDELIGSELLLINENIVEINIHFEQVSFQSLAYHHLTNSISHN